MNHSFYVIWMYESEFTKTKLQSQCKSLHQFWNAQNSVTLFAPRWMFWARLAKYYECLIFDCYVKWTRGSCTLVSDDSSFVNFHSQICPPPHSDTTAESWIILCGRCTVCPRFTKNYVYFCDITRLRFFLASQNLTVVIPGFWRRMIKETFIEIFLDVFCY